MKQLAINSLSVRFGGVTALSDLTFEMHGTEVLGIIGPNGAGKTTLFNVLSRFCDAAHGSAHYGDVDLLALRPEQVAGAQIARTFQNIELFGRATVLDNLLMGRYQKDGTSLWQQLAFTPGSKRSELKHRAFVEEIVDFLDLHEYRDQVIAQLPYGVRKVVELGRALCLEPSLLLLDEPSSGLNPEESEDMVYWIEDIRDDLGIAVLMIEHDMSLVTGVCDRVLALNYGRTITSGKPSEVLRHPEVLDAYLGHAKP